MNKNVQMVRELVNTLCFSYDFINMHCLCGVSVNVLLDLRLPPTSQKYAGMWIGYAKFSLGMNVCTW